MAQNISISPETSPGPPSQSLPTGHPYSAFLNHRLDLRVLESRKTEPGSVYFFAPFVQQNVFEIHPQISFVERSSFLSSFLSFFVSLFLSFYCGVVFPSVNKPQFVVDS